MNIPEEVPVDKKDIERLRHLNLKLESLQKFIQMMISQGEQQIASYNSEAKQIWEELGIKYGLDLENVNWAPHMHGDMLIPISVRLNNGNSNSDKGKV